MNWLQRSLFNKLLAIIAGGCLLIVLAAFFYFKQVNAGIERYNSLLDQEISYERQIGEVLIAFKVQVQEWKNVLLRGYDDTQRDKYWNQFQAEERKIRDKGNTLLGFIKGTTSGDKFQEFLAAHESMGAKYREGYQKFVASGGDPKVGDAAVKGIDREPTVLLEQAVMDLSEKAHNASIDIRDNVSSASWISALLVLLAIATFLAVAMVVINSAIVKPSRELVSLVNALSNGNLGGSIRIQRDDELGVLADAARRLQEFLRNVAQEINRTASEQGTASANLDSAAASISDHTVSANDRITQMATAMQEMTSAAQGVASHAQEAATLAHDANQAAISGMSAMDRAQDAVEKLSSQIESSVEIVRKLDTDTKNVGNVLSVIRAIAEQTNLLALNAAIEAARAGEQGRGFAVVADEVRTLAQRTQASTAEIQGIIENVQSGARNTVTVMETSQTISSQSVDIFRDAGSQLQRITASISDISGLNTQVATAAEEQTSVAEDIARNITEVAEQTEEMAQTAAGMEDVTGVLRQMSNRNRELANRFNMNAV